MSLTEYVLLIDIGLRGLWDTEINFLAGLVVRSNMGAREKGKNLFSYYDCCPKEEANMYMTALCQCCAIDLDLHQQQLINRKELKSRG